MPMNLKNTLLYRKGAKGRKENQGLPAVVA